MYIWVINGLIFVAISIQFTVHSSNTSNVQNNFILKNSKARKQYFFVIQKILPNKALLKSVNIDFYKPDRLCGICIFIALTWYLSNGCTSFGIQEN